MKANLALSDLGVADARAWAHPDTAGRPALLRALPAAMIASAVATDTIVMLASFTVAQEVPVVAASTTGGLAGGGLSVSALIVLGVIAVGLLASRGLYDLDQPQPWPSQLYAIVSSISTALVVTIALSVVLGTELAPSWPVAGSALAVAALFIWHSATARLNAVLRASLFPRRRAIVVGANVAGREHARELEARGYQVIGYADNGSDLLDENERPLLGPIARLDELIESHAVDDLVIALPSDRREQISRVLTRGFNRRIRVKYAADFADLLPRRFDIRRIGVRHYIDFAPVARVSWLKRAVDLLLAASAGVVLIPLLVGVAIAIKLDSPGPILYGHLRLGKDGRPFRMLKFRSMRPDADRMVSELIHLNEVSGPMFKIRRDPRVTRVGRFLRRYSLDELPQLLNVLRGDMSLVGPRPPTPSEVQRYEEWQFGRLRAVPGITGLWQVSGRTEVPFHDMVRLDLHYIRNWSFQLDVEILLRTIPAVLTTKGAY